MVLCRLFPGVMLLILAVLYFMKTFQNSRCTRQRDIKGTNRSKDQTSKEDHLDSVLEYTDDERGFVTDRPILHSQEGRSETNTLHSQKESGVVTNTLHSQDLPDLLQNHRNRHNEQHIIQDQGDLNTKQLNNTQTQEKPLPESTSISSDTGQNSKHPPDGTHDSNLESKPVIKPKQKERDKHLVLQSPSLLRFLTGASPDITDEEAVTMVTMVSSQRTEAEDEEFYPNRGDPLSDIETESVGAAAGFEWDPDNRG